MEKNIAMRVHSNESGSVLAAADAQLVGQTLREGKIALNVSKTFYLEKTVDEKEFSQQLDEAGNVNLVGEITFNVAVKKGLLTSNEGMRIAGVPHVQIYKI